MTENKLALLDPTPEREPILAAETEAAKTLRSVTIEDGAIVMVGSDEAQRRVVAAFGSESHEFMTYAITQLVEILPEGTDESHYTLAVNSAVAMLSAINPQNELEAMLAAQMVACNHMALMSTRRANNAETIDSRQLNGNLATKFSRTFVAQLEALDRHRRGGKQIVEHVHINAGGQAVIAGTVNTGSGG